jgi:hypothetical protein
LVSRPPTCITDQVSSTCPAISRASHHFWREYGVVAEADGLLKYQAGARLMAEKVGFSSLLP